MGNGKSAKDVQYLKVLKLYLEFNLNYVLEPEYFACGEYGGGGQDNAYCGGLGGVQEER